MNYEEAVAWIDTFQQFGIRLGLNRIEVVLNAVDNPQKKTSFIHVAGTNGKGSVCRYISSILTNEGYRTGLYLSPHLVDFRERFQLNNEFIKKDRFVEIVDRIRPIVEQVTDRGIQLTYFEICTIIAFLFFADEQVDYAVVEVGLGGRYDATNVITPLVSIITTVSLDHQDQLGNTIEDIAFEKAGIIKSNIPVVTAAEGNAIEVIETICKKQHSELTHVTERMVSLQETSLFHQLLLVHGCFDDYLVKTHQLGRCQWINIAISITVIEILQQKGVFITKDSILKGINKMRHPGRMQLLQTHPFVLIDGAHNTDAMRKTVESLTSFFTLDRLIVIFGVMKDKSISEMLSLLLPVTDILIATEPKNTRATSAEKIAKYVQKIDASKQFFTTSSVQDAYAKALTIAKEHDLIFATGSLFTVGELLQLLEET